MTYSFIVPIYNDAYLAEDFCTEFKKVFEVYLNEKNIENQVELIFVNDGSKNNSIEILKDLSKKYAFVKCIDLSRNFGQHIALSCGYAHAKGSYIGMLNVDMQDPPDQIPLLLNYMKESNCDIVFGLRNQRKDPWRERITSKLFNITLNKLTGSNTPLNVATIRVMNRKFIDAYNLLTEKSRFLPGLEFWLGFKHGYVNTKHSERKEGKSSYTFRSRMRMALDSIISFSDLPLKFIAFIGLFIASAGFVLTVALIISKIFFIDYKPGYTSTISLITFLGGVQIMVIGFASLYIGRILKEVQNRPLYIINNKYNF